MRMIVYPFGYDSEPIVRHANLLEPSYEIVALVSPSGWGLAGKNMEIEHDGKVLTIHESFNEVKEKYEGLLIPIFDTIEVVENRIVDMIINQIPYLSCIYCTTKLTESNQLKIRQACNESGEQCNLINLTEYEEFNDYRTNMVNDKFPTLKPLSVPVVVISGLWEKTDKFELSLSLRERFIDYGYCVSQIASREGCMIFGFHSFPNFMFDKNIDSIDKIVYFNFCIYQIIKDEKPDLVIITIPGAIQNYNDFFTRGFGVLHHLVMQAVVPDVFLMCTFYMREAKKYLKNISDSCKYKYGIPVDAFHMSNLLIDDVESDEQACIVTNSIYREIVSKTITEDLLDNPIPVFNSYDSNECDKLFDLILNILLAKDDQVII